KGSEDGWIAQRFEHFSPQLAFQIDLAACAICVRERDTVLPDVTCLCQPWCHSHSKGSILLSGFRCSASRQSSSRSLLRICNHSRTRRCARGGKAPDMISPVLMFT